MIFSTCSFRKPRFFFFAVAFLALQVCAASTASAYSYSIFGSVYSAARLMPGQTAPNNPLSAYSPSLILKDKDLKDIDLYAVTTRSMVRVSVENANGAPLAKPFLVKYSGGYNFSFNNAASSLNVKLVVRNAINNEKLMESPVTTLSPNANTRYLLVEGDPDDIGLPHPGTKLFTMVGRIPNDGTSINSTTGLATVPAATASMFGIPQYKNAPFGGTLYINGAFSSQYYPSGIGPDQYCYKAFANNVPIKGPLYKTRYTVTDVNGTLTVKAEQILVGPKIIGSTADCYAITPITQAQLDQEVFWNLPDQLINWNTAPNNGLFNITLKVYNTTTNSEVILSQNQFSSLKLMINNEPVVVGFTQITNGAKNMLDPANACDIVNMAQGLNITYKAYHPNPAGYLLYYAAYAVPNSGNAVPMLTQNGNKVSSIWYSGVPLTGTPAGGASVALSSGSAPGQVDHSCAYIFKLSALARTTNGYWYINGGYAEKAYYLK